MKIKPIHKVVLYGCIFLLSCQNKENTGNELFSSEELNIDDMEVLDEDKDPVNELYIIEDKAVIFFIVSKKEMEKLNRELGSSYRYETDMMFNNFIRQAENFKKILAKHNIYSELARNKRFLIKLKNGQTINFNRIREDQIMGEIITDGVQEPIIEFGMYRNKELVALIKDYFKIKNIEQVKEPPLIFRNENNEIDTLEYDVNKLDTIPVK